MTSNSQLIERINVLKKEKKAVLLTHYYQKPEMYEIADFIGDSLALSKQAAETSAEKIVFCGVTFMAETAKILSPQKKVFMPNIESGCPMADMITAKQLKNLKAKHPGAVVVCYVNSSAEVKAESDICCTSANAVKVMQSIKENKIIFVPDKGLGAYTAQFVPDKEVILHEGYCPIHWEITPDEITMKKQKYPDAKLLAHPECGKPVLDLANYIGSTTGILKYARESADKAFIIASEEGIVTYMKNDMPDKQFVMASENAICKDMKYNTLEQVVDCLENETNEIFVDPEISQKALGCIDRMLKI